MARKKKEIDKKAPTNLRTVSAVVERPEFVEEIKVEGFRRGYESASSAAAKILDLGWEEFLKLPVIPTRQNI